MGVIVSIDTIYSISWFLDLDLDHAY